LAGLAIVTLASGASLAMEPEIERAPDTGGAPAPKSEDGATPATPEIEAAIQQTIIGQIEAFQSDDGARALEFAVPQAAQVWQSPEAFMTMVREGYEPIYRPQSFSFVLAVAERGTANQVMRVTGENGETVIALYSMYRQSDGRWLIGGVQTFDVEDEEEEL
jgi:hypothetical protein